jgi:ubiquitin-protein ligase
MDDVHLYGEGGNVKIVYNLLEMEIVFEDAYKPINNIAEEKLLCLLLNNCGRGKRCENETDKIKELTRQLTNYCVACGELLEFDSNELLVCGKTRCQYTSEEILIDDYVVNYFKRDPSVTRFLLETTYHAAKSSKRSLIYEPFPNTQLPRGQLPRGQLSVLQGGTPTKDFTKIDQIVADHKLNDVIKNIGASETDKNLCNSLGKDAYGFIKFSLKSNNTDLREVNLVDALELKINTTPVTSFKKPKSVSFDLDSLKQFEISHHPRVEESFKRDAQKFGTMYLYHGSSNDNWYSIMRNGLKICSNTRLMTTGAAYGTGIYLSNMLSVSLGYAPGNPCIIGVYEVISDPKKLHKKTPNIFVATDDKILLLRYLITTQRSLIENTDLHLKLDKRFEGLACDKKTVAKIQTSLCSKRLLSEYKKLMKADSSVLGFYINLPDEANMYIWDVFINKFEGNIELQQSLDHLKIPHIKLEIRFPDNYPVTPPYIRVVTPRFVFRTGHITAGGSICMEILTSQGWSPLYSIESLIVDIKCLLSEGSAKIDTTNSTPYSFQESKEAFFRAAASHGWKV